MSLSRILGKPQGAHSFAGDSRWVLPSCMMGWEFEYEGVEDRVLPRHTFSGFWQYHEEGSLRDNGAEFVFANPIFGVDAYNALHWLTTYASANKWKCTKRTGVHVHVDVRDLESPQLVGLCILYAALEPLIYKWVGEGRENSHFCLPLYKADQALLATCNILSAALMDHKTDSHSALIAAEGYQRYAGFNLQALAKFGSIEFRHLQTTNDLTRLVDWGNILLSLKATAFKLPQSDGAVVRMMTRMGIWELLNYVFPARIAAQLYTNDAALLFRKYGLPSARDIAVHACGSDEWITSSYPKNKLGGFYKWAKGKGKEAKPNPAAAIVERIRDADDMLVDEFNAPQFQRAAAPRPAGVQLQQWDFGRMAEDALQVQPRARVVPQQRINEALGRPARRNPR